MHVSDELHILFVATYAVSDWTNLKSTGPDCTVWAQKSWFGLQDRLWS